MTSFTVLSPDFILSISENNPSDSPANGLLPSASHAIPLFIVSMRSLMMGSLDIWSAISDISFGMSGNLSTSQSKNFSISSATSSPSASLPKKSPMFAVTFKTSGADLLNWLNTLPITLRIPSATATISLPMDLTTLSGPSNVLFNLSTFEVI